MFTCLVLFCVSLRREQVRKKKKWLKEKKKAKCYLNISLVRFENHCIDFRIKHKCECNFNVVVHFSWMLLVLHKSRCSIHTTNRALVNGIYTWKSRRESKREREKNGREYQRDVTSFFHPIVSKPCFPTQVQNAL